MAETVAVIDFETTGIAPYQGARATEIAVVRVRDGVVVDRFDSLMRSGARVPPFIQALTGISDEMLRTAPPADAVMREAMAFTRGCPLVAHNASFDRAFWLAEAARAGCDADPAHDFACTVLLSRRLHPQAPNHRLGTLAGFHGIAPQGRAHRALADALTAAAVFVHQQREVVARLAGAAPGASAAAAASRTAGGTGTAGAVGAASASGTAGAAGRAAVPTGAVGGGAGPAGAATGAAGAPAAVTHALLRQLQQVPRPRVDGWLADRAAAAAGPRDGRRAAA